jgi:hypothetical protein
VVAVVAGGGLVDAWSEATSSSEGMSPAAAPALGHRGHQLAETPWAFAAASSVTSRWVVVDLLSRTWNCGLASLPSLASRIRNP